MVSTANVLQPADMFGADHPPRFVCSEVWGGNRPISVPIELPGIRGRIFSRPCDGGRGGDVHYVSICGSGLLSRLCVADVAGHGETVAKVSGELHTLLRRYMNHPDQRRVLAALNRRLEASEIGRMTTAAAVSYFPPTRKLSVSYAGHPPAWLLRKAEGRWKQLRPASFDRRDRRMIDLPLAITQETTFSRRKLRTHNGDRLLVLTDGILEAPGAKDELYGEERLVKLLNEHAEADLDTLAEAVLASVVEHAQDKTLGHDDVTFLLIEFVPGPRALGMWQVVRNRLLRPRRGQPGS